MNRYEEEYLENIPENNPFLGSNIRVLRIEARLKEKDLADSLNVTVDVIKSWEKGLTVPSTEQLLKMLPLLRIGHYDIMTRNIQEERDNAEKAIRKSKDRNNYNWYYGDRSVVALNIIYLILIPLLFILLAYPLSFFTNFIYISFGDIVLIGPDTPLLRAYAVVAFTSGVLIVVKFLKRIRYHFQIWHLFWIAPLLAVVMIIGIIGTVPYYIYIIVRLIVLRGRNHL